MRSELRSGDASPLMNAEDTEFLRITALKRPAERRSKFRASENSKNDRRSRKFPSDGGFAYRRRFPADRRELARGRVSVRVSSGPTCPSLKAKWLVSLPGVPPRRRRR